jgi:hypothetical protein
MSDWITELDRDELVTFLPAGALGDLPLENAARKVAFEMAKKGLIPHRLLPFAPPRTTHRITKDGKIAGTRGSRKSLWPLVYDEFHLLICTNDKKYAKLRKSLGKSGEKTTFAIVTAISVAIGEYIHVGVAICAPFISLLLLTAMEIGKNVFCKSKIEDQMPAQKQRKAAPRRKRANKTKQ